MAQEDNSEMSEKTPEPAVEQAMPDTDAAHSDAAAPLNRAQRRAQARGKAAANPANAAAGQSGGRSGPNARPGGHAGPVRFPRTGHK